MSIYEHESDYRKIPREYLNRNIPKGRGIVKWNAFKTLPEQYAQLEQHIKNQDKIDKPELSIDQIDTLNNVLKEKVHNNDICEVMYYEAGYIEQIIGYITKVNIYQNEIILKNDIGKNIRIELDNIIQLN